MSEDGSGSPIAGFIRKWKKESKSRVKRRLTPLWGGREKDLETHQGTCENRKLGTDDSVQDGGGGSWSRWCPSPAWRSWKKGGGEEDQGWLPCYLCSETTIKCPYSRTVHFKICKNSELSRPSELGETAFQKWCQEGIKLKVSKIPIFLNER